MEETYRRKIQLIKRNFDATSEHYLDDEIVIDVLNGDVKEEGICFLSDYSGLYHAQRTSVRVSSAYQEGSYPSNFPRTDERSLQIRLGTKAKTAKRHEQIESILWHIIRMDQDCVLRVWTDDAYRELRVRLENTPKDAWRYDPEVYKNLVWTIQLVASDPWWKGELFTDQWTNTDGTGSGSVVVPNPADQPAYVQWATGAIAPAGEIWTLPDVGQVKSDGYPLFIQLPRVMPGDEFLVDTYPLSMPIDTLSNVQLAGELRMKKFRGSIPPGTDYIKLPVYLAGGNAQSTIKAYVQTRWERPWGGEAWTSLPPI